MTNSNSGIPNVTIGMDLGDRFSYLHVLAHDGEVLEEGRIRTTAKALQERFERTEPARVALETGTHSPWISRLLAECGHQVIVANSRQLRLIYENKNKSDKIDAEYLARIARLDPELLKPVRHRSARAQTVLAVIRARDTLVKARTQFINHVRGAVKSFGGRVTGCTPGTFGTKALESIPKPLLGAMTPLLDLVREVTTKINLLDKEIEKVSKETFKETSRLRQIHGVGPLTALAFVLILDDPHRFKNSRCVGAYLGLTPRRDESGNHQPQLRITKAGDNLLRRLLVTCAHYILGPFGADSDLRRHGEAIARRGGKNAKKRAAVAVARKLAVLLHRLWISGQEYEPLRAQGRRSAANRSLATATH